MRTDTPEAGRSQLAEEREHEFKTAIDITRARSGRIRPLASCVTALPSDAEYIEATPDSGKGRIERWQAKLLDLSLRNRLLNFKQSKQTVPCDVPDLGLLEDALAANKSFRLYGRGAGRTNADEAKAIVEMIRQRLTTWLKLPEADRPTLGVITFNAQQQSLILDLLDQMRRNNADFEWFFADEREEPLIVKNLENIQGDERDVMLFSITFAPDAAGKFTINFGALNSDGGEKRLNVAVTRARSELHVFASVTHNQIDLSRTRATGVRDLKTFLDYAERGPIALPARDEGSLHPTENPFEDAIASVFRTKGWEVHTQIGVSGFQIDLGIVHPDSAGAYLAGIECDGATYHSSATARDRDKVRQAVLENLGWTILRIWSADWFRDPASVVNRLHAELVGLLETDRAEQLEAEAGTDIKNLVRQS